VLHDQTCEQSVLCAGLGYGSGSESDDNADDTSRTGRESPTAESSDDEELQDRIRRKKVDFERKMQELEERDSGEQETQLFLCDFFHFIITCHLWQIAAVRHYVCGCLFSLWVRDQVG